MYHARKIQATILFETGHGNKKHLLNIAKLSKVYSERMCETMLAIHAFTGCDIVDAFKGIGKVKALKLILKNSELCDSMLHLGDE